MSDARVRPLDGQLRLLTKVARMYHEQGLRQATIAESLGLSQAKVSRLLKRAAESGIVRVSVEVAPGLHSELEDEVEARYGLAEAVVVDVEPGSAYADVIASIGAGAAAHLEATLTGADRIGVSTWSQTLLAMVERMRPLPTRGAVEVVQLLGGVGASETQSHATRLLGDLARRLGAEPVSVPAPGLVADRGMRDALLADAAMRGVRERWDRLTLAIVGLGGIEPSPVLAGSGNAFAEPERAQLTARGAVGDICHRVFDAEGAQITGEVDDRVLAIGADSLRAVPRRIGVAGGAHKIAAIRGALLGGWVTVLVTDAETARLLLEDPPAAS